MSGDWRPGADLAALRARATMLAEVRAWFAARGVLEVETPLAATTAGTDPALAPLVTRYTGPEHPAGVDLYLQTSPEFAMKRLLAAGAGAIYQICKAFRDGEAGRLHNPEFSLLEWYRPGRGLDALMADVADVAVLALDRPGLGSTRRDYTGLFAAAFGIDVLDAAPAVLRAIAHDHGLPARDDWSLDRDGWCDLLFSHLIQPTLGDGVLCFVTDYPASQAALARRNPDGRTAARFELFFHGIELANGFDELTDAAEQRTRFDADNRERHRRGLRPVPVDVHLLAALEQGLPDCAGVAMGLDRLLMQRVGADGLDRVISFSLPRC